jgi:Ca2+:H+ antiporter
MHIVLLALTSVVAVLTVVPGRATLLQAGVHLTLLSAYLFLSFLPWRAEAQPTSRCWENP